MEEVINYIKKVFGLHLNFTEIGKDRIKGLPFYIVNEYAFWEVIILDRTIVFANKNTTEHFTPDQYKKQMELLENNFNNIVVLVLPEIETYNRNRLIQKRINFMIANKQIFIPSLIVDIKEYTIKTKQKEYLQPAAQCLILFHLQKQTLNNFNYKQLAEIMKLPYLNITRAVENIQFLGLCKVDGTKEKSIRFEDNKKELWEKALPFLKNPVLKTVYIDHEILDFTLYKSNINALAHYTDINDEKQNYIALQKNLFKKFQKEGTVKKYSDYEGEYCLELWKYNPGILTNNEYIDPLSAYLLFKDNKNERIEMALEQIIEQQKW